MGYGAVAQCTLPIFVKAHRAARRTSRSWTSRTAREVLKPWTARACASSATGSRRRTWARCWASTWRPGDLLIDLAWNIDCCELLQWCHDRGVLYVNTSVEVWDPYAGADDKHPTERTLYWRHMNIRRMKAGWNEPGPTAVLEHGANPGLISHLTKQGLIDIGERLLDDKQGRRARTPRRSGSWSTTARSTAWP